MRFLQAIGDAVFRIPWWLSPAALLFLAMPRGFICHFPWPVSTLPVRVVADRSGAPVRFRVALPNREEYFDPRRWRSISVYPCASTQEAEYQTPSWAARARSGPGDAMRHHFDKLWGRDTLRFEIGYGANPAGWSTEAPARSLKRGVLYVFEMHVDVRMARAVFVVEGDSVRQATFRHRLSSVEECRDRLRSGNELPSLYQSETPSPLGPSLNGK